MNIIYMVHKFYMLLLSAFTIIIPAEKELRYENATYEEEIRTVKLYPNTGSFYDVLEPSVTQLGQVNLTLEFDDLVQDAETYKVRLIHCNADWTKSNFHNLDFLYKYNEFNITQYEYSVDTKVKYVHYSFNVPNVKVPGNYLLVVYRGTNEKDIILSHRFMVYQNLVSVELESPLTGMTSSSRFNQQLDFKINYQNAEITNPRETIKVVMRKNERPDAVITDLKPSFVREGQSEIEYRFFNFENNFRGGNEYRFFDLRSLRNPGANVNKVNWSEYPTQVELMTDKAKTHEAYAQNNDINGDYYIANTDSGLGTNSADYVYTWFYLKSAEQLPGTVYVAGKMNNFKNSPSSRMTYHTNTRMYTTKLLLKQGWYNYQYYIASDTLSPTYLEGDHFETENMYEIFIYHRPMTSRSDLLIGYSRHELNPRN